MLQAPYPELDDLLQLMGEAGRHLAKSKPAKGAAGNISVTEIHDDQWKKLYSYLQRHPRAYAGKEDECRLFVEAVHWILRSGAQWRLLPKKYGNWNSVYKRYFAGDPDMENILLDSTIV